MNKVKINLDKTNLNAIIYILNTLEFKIEPSNFTFKALLSICEELTIRFEKKAITERKNTKNFNISLKYYEAFALENILRHFINTTKDDLYILNSATLIANQINVQL